MSVQIAGLSGTLAEVNGSNQLEVTGSIAVSNFPATQTVSGTVAVTQSTSPWVVSLTSTTITGVVATTNQGGLSGLVSDVQTKGVQGNNATMVQEFKDAGRVIKVFSLAFTPTNAEAMLTTVSPITDGVAGVAAQTFSITAGKRLRLQSFAVSKEATTAAAGGVVANLRMAASGAITTASPLIATVAAAGETATIGVSGSGCTSFPDGLELSGAMTFGISVVGSAIAACWVTLIGYEY